MTKPIHFAHGIGLYKEVWTCCGKNWPSDKLILTNIPGKTTCKSCRRHWNFPDNLPANVALPKVQRHGPAD